MFAEGPGLAQVSALVMRWQLEWVQVYRHPLHKLQALLRLKLKRHPVQFSCNHYPMHFTRMLECEEDMAIVDIELLKKSASAPRQRTPAPPLAI